jgi:hypothetical protein
LPLSSAVERCSATVSVTLATWSRRMRPAVAERDLHGAEFLGRATVAMVRTDCSAPPMSERAARGFLLDLAQLAGDIGCRGAQREQAGRIEFDADFARHAADPRHGADAAHAENATWSPCCRRTTTAPRRPCGSTPRCRSGSARRRG